MRYDEVRVTLSATSRGRFKAQVSFAGASPVARTFKPPAGVDAEAIYREWYDSFKPPPPSPAALRAMETRRRQAGEMLFAALFAAAANDIHERLTALETRRRSVNGTPRGLRLRLILGDAFRRGPSGAATLLPVSSLPYELIVPPGDLRFLARRPYVSIVRTFGVAGVAEVMGPIAVSGKLRVLIASAQPKGSGPVGWEQEVARIQERLAGRTDTTVEVLARASFADTRERLRDGGFHIFHFIGHGEHDAGSGEWCLLFEDDQRKQQPVLAGELADHLGNLPALQLAVLSACRSGQLARQAGSDPLAGIAAALSASGVPAVIGMQLETTVGAAIDFAGAFYGALRQGESIEAALAGARSAIDFSSPEWATPVLYLRGETSELFEFEVEVESNGAALASAGPRDLMLGIRTLVESPRFPHLAEWAQRLENTSERLLALEEFFSGRFIVNPGWWNVRVLPRLEQFLAEAVAQGRPLVLSLAAHGTVAFAAGYYFHTKTATSITLVQVTSGDTLRWSEQVGSCPSGALWESFAEQVLDPQEQDVAVAVAITQSTAAAARAYIAQSGTRIGQLVCATITGGPGQARVENGAHAYRLAWELQQWLMDHTGNRHQRRLHLFIAAPNGFLFFFGQLARSLGCLRLYEFDFEAKGHATYEPSLDLPQKELVDEMG